MFWEFTGTKSDSDIVIFDDLTGESISEGKLKSDIDNYKKKLSSDRKCLVFIFSNNSYASIIAYLSVLNSGHALCLIDEKMESSLYQNLLDTYKPEIIWKSISEDQAITDYIFQKFDDNFGFYFREKISNNSVIHEDTAVLLTTSGTTGSPKLVRLSYRNIESNARSISQYLQLSPREKAITTLPMHYSYGLSVINSHLSAKASLVCTDKTVIERSFWILFNQQACTSFAGVPYTFEILKRLKFENIETPSLRSVTQAGGSLNPKLIQHFYDLSQKKHFSFYVMYGQTEASPRISYVPYPKLSKKIGSIGIAIPKGKLGIIKDGKWVTESGKQGELVYEGHNVMLGYAKKRKDLKKGDDLNGTLYTGDIGYFDADGYFYLSGRLKRIIKIFGQRIDLDEVEQMLKHHFKKEVACFGSEDKLCVVLQSGDKTDTKRVVDKLTSLYHIHHTAIRSHCLNSLIYTFSGKKDYQAMGMKVNNENT